MALDARVLDLIATVIECCEGQRESGPGRPRAETVRVLSTLRPWRCARHACARAPHGQPAGEHGPGQRLNTAPLDRTLGA